MTKNKLSIIYQPRENLVKYNKNARTHSDEQVAQIAKSIEEFGFTNPILVDEKNIIIAGHGRLAAAEVLKLDAVPTIPQSAISKTGDVWILGQHRVACGDCTDPSIIKKLMQGWQVDLLLTDPPYNVAYEGKTKDALTIQNDSMSDERFREFLRASYQAANSVMRPGAVFYIWHADSEGYNFRGAAQDIGWKVRQCLIWKKQTMVMGRQDYHWQHEPCLYGWKDGAAHVWASDRKQTTILEFDRPMRNAEHPTMKPIALLEYQIKNNTKRGHCVLDIFGGSGSTLIACQKTDRIARMVEIDPIYVDVIIRRWQEYTGLLAIHEDTGKTFAQVEEQCSAA